MLSVDTKIFILNLVAKAVYSGCRKTLACQEVGIDIRTLQRWERGKDLIDRRTLHHHIPANKLSEPDKARVVELLNSEEFKDKTPWEIVPTLTDREEYIASESTMYRIMRQVKLNRHRSRSMPKRHHKPKAYAATGPNQVWSWDITYLRTSVRGQFYYLYMIMDIYSRKIVGWRVHETEDMLHSSHLISETCLLEEVKEDSLVLHSDNGGPMKGSTMLSTLQQLGVVSSFSRPRVSNDNPFSEALFKTLKYNPYYPGKPFTSLDETNRWVVWFVTWYNNERLHGEINYVTPVSRHNLEDEAILAKRRAVYEKARNKHPERWSKNTRSWTHQGEVHLNPDFKQKEQSVILQAA